VRDGANRALGFAVLASILIHALVIAELPPLRARRAPEPPPPLIARIVEVAPPAPRSIAPAPPEIERPAKPPPRAQAPRPRPVEPIARRAPAPVVAPIPEPIPTPPAAPVAVPAPAPATAPPAAPSPVITRIDPRLLEPPAPPPNEALALGRYRDAVVVAAAPFKRYPRVAIDNNWQGEVRVRLSIGADGHIAGLEVAQGSGYEVLDRQALEMFRNAKPFVPIPPELRGKAFDVELRAVYNLSESG